MILLLSATLLPLSCARPQPHNPSTPAPPPSSSSPAPPPPPPPPPVVTASRVAPDPTVGALFLGAGDLHTCTAAVLHSSIGNLILTAAHCLASTYPTNFVPGFSGQADPAHTWTVDAIYLDPRWLGSHDPLADFAIARVHQNGGTSVESAVGTGLTLGTAPAAGTVVTVTGYPLTVGGTPIGCHGGTEMAPGGFPSVQCSGMVAGTSGAPWRVDSTVVGLIGGLHGGGCDENVSYSPPFDGRLADLLHRAEAGGPADTAPEVFSDDC